MAIATAQQIVDRASQELGLATSNLTAGLITQVGTQSLALLNSLGDDLVHDFDWQFLMKTATITGDGVSTSYPLPIDFGHTVNQTMWSSNNKMPMIGPQTPQQWGWLQFGIVSVGVYYRYRIVENSLEVFPVLPLNEVVNFYYIDKNWVLDQDGVTYKDEITNPGDMPLFDKGLCIKGLKTRLWAQKGFDTTVLSKEYNDHLSAEQAQSAAAPTLYLSGNYGGILIDAYRNIPEGNW